MAKTKNAITSSAAIENALATATLLKLEANELLRTEAEEIQEIPKTTPAKATTGPVEDAFQATPYSNVQHVPGDLKEMVSKVEEDQKAAMSAAVQVQFDDRVAFELTKNPNNGSIQKNLKSYGKRMTSNTTAGVFVATSIDPTFINREVSAGSRYNVYALDKLNDLVLAMTAGVLQNAINNAVTRSLFKFRAEGAAFTGIAANAAVSDKIRVDRKLAAMLIRHTASPSTAPTQSSSTMSALQTLGIVVNKGSKKYPLWELTDTPQTRRLEEVLLKVA